MYVPLHLSVSPLPVSLLPLVISECGLSDKWGWWAAATGAAAGVMPYVHRAVHGTTPSSGRLPRAELYVLLRVLLHMQLLWLRASLYAASVFLILLVIPHSIDQWFLRVAYKSQLH